MLASPDTNRDVETLRSNGVEGKPTSVVADGSCKEETVPDVNILDVARQYLSRLSDGAEPEELDSIFAPMSSKRNSPTDCCHTGRREIYRP